jgi:hypothetical protein
MGGGLIQLVAYGIQDIYLTSEPQITFFKIIYRRYTNFSVEQIPQFFDKRATFGETVTCTLSRNGDLVHRIYLYVTLPNVPKFYNRFTNSYDETVKFAWCRKIGYVLIQSVEIEIGGQKIDKHYGEWLHIWDEISGKKTDRGLDIMIGNVPEMYDFTTGKNNYSLFVPLQFWFCRNNGLSLPLISLQYNEVKIHVKFRKAEECYVVIPTHQYEIVEDICSFDFGDIIEQEVNNKKIKAMFVSNNPVTKTINYLKINNTNNDKFTSATIPKSFFKDQETGTINYSLYNNAVNNPDSKENSPYHLYNENLYCTPAPNKTEVALNYYNVSMFSFQQAYLLVDYVYLDNDERLRFARSNHEYLIEQLQLAKEETVVNNNISIMLALNHPCKALYWVCQMDYLVHKNINDTFNYTDNYNKKGDGTYIGDNLVKKATVLLNGRERFSIRDGEYFNWVQPYQHFSNSPCTGINCYSLSIMPEQSQPSGTCNMSRIDNINLLLTLNTIINYYYSAKVRVYTVNYNVLRILHGLSGIAFIN